VCVDASLQQPVHNNAPSVGADICKSFDISPIDLYFKWESIVLGQNTIGGRFIDETTPSSIRSFIRTERAKIVLAQNVKGESGLRKAKAGPMDMLGLGPRMKFTGVGVVDTAPNLQSSSSSTIPRVGKVGASRIEFECYDIEAVSWDKRNCTRHSVFWRYQFSQ